MTTQHYFNGSYIQETVHDVTTKIRQRKKYMTCTDKYYVDVSFNLKKSGSNNMYTFFYYDISEFAENLEGMIDEGTYTTTIQNMHKLGLKAQLFNSDGFSMLDHVCGVLQYLQFYDRIII